MPPSQLGARYEAGREEPPDVEVFYEEGRVLKALGSCALDRHASWLAEALRHARATQAGAMFLCLPSATARALPGRFTYRFSVPEMLAQLMRQEQQLLSRRIAAWPCPPFLASCPFRALPVVPGRNAAGSARRELLEDFLNRAASNGTKKFALPASC